MGDFVQMQEWEYKTIRQEVTGFLSRKLDNSELDNELNKAGAEGWELCKTVPILEAYGTTKFILFIMKRRERLMNRRLSA